MQTNNDNKAKLSFKDPKEPHIPRGPTRKKNARYLLLPENDWRNVLRPTIADVIPCWQSPPSPSQGPGSPRDPEDQRDPHVTAIETSGQAKGP